MAILADTLAQRYSPLPGQLRAALQSIEPSRDGSMIYHPCRAILEGGFAVDTVYLEPEGPYFRHWGIYPEDDKCKFWIPIELVTAIGESPVRLPACFANEVYSWGPTGLGYFIFTLIFSDGTQATCHAGSAIDFIQYPEGKGPADVVDVLPFTGRKDSNMLRSPRYFWCLYADEA